MDSHPLRHNLIVYKFGEHLEESLWMDGMFTKMCFNSPWTLDAFL
jgi:hypothetical protein